MNKRIISRLLLIISVISIGTGPNFSFNRISTSVHTSVIEGGVPERLSFDVEVAWESMEVAPVTIGKQTFWSISLNDTNEFSKPGAPIIPVISRTLAIPFGVSLKLKVTPENPHVIRVAGEVLPGPTQSAEWNLDKINFADANMPEILVTSERDNSIYASDTPFPGKNGEIASDGVIRQQRITGIILFPLQYNPVERVIILYEKLHVDVILSGNYILSNTNPRPESEAYEQILGSSVDNYEEGKQWRLSPLEQEQLGVGGSKTNNLKQSAPWTPPNPGWRIKVQQQGFYRLTYDQLAAAGVPVDQLDPLTFQMFSMGIEIPIKVVGEGDGSFDANDTILFYGESVHSKYANNNVYWLTYGLDQGLRVEKRDITPQSAELENSCLFELSKEESHYYISWLPGTDELERYIWTFAQAGSQKSLSLNLTDVDTSMGGTLRIRLMGASEVSDQNPDHHVVVSLNGTFLDDLYWDGRNWLEKDIAIPTGVIVDGNNTLSLALPGDTGAGNLDAIYLDSMKIFYERYFVAHSDLFAFSQPNSGEHRYQVSNFSTLEVLLFDTSNPSEISELIGATITQNGPTYRVEFEDLTGENNPNNYWLGSESSLLTVTGLERDVPSNLEETSNRADYLIISPSIFLQQATNLLVLRESQGFQAMLIDVQDVYDQFNFGIVSPYALRDFFAYADHFWTSPAPSFVLLIGDGNYDPKNYEGYGKESFLPPFLVVADPLIGETAADNRYVDIDGLDNLPDMMIGRLAVNTAAELTNTINKLSSYEAMPAFQDWQSRLLVIADNTDEGGNFSALAQSLIACCVTPNYQPERVYLGVTHLTVSAAHEAIQNNINEGEIIVNYIGHAAQSQWAGYDVNPAFNGPLLSRNDVPTLNNQDRYPFVLAMTCWEGYFINPQPSGTNYDSLAETITRAQSKGAIGSWSPTGTSFVGGHDILDKQFFQSFFMENSDRIGQAIAESLIDLWSTGTHLDLIDTFMLFGDPATLINRIGMNIYLPMVAR